MTQALEGPGTPANPPNPARELPKLGARDMFKRLLNASQERNDMLSGLRNTHEKNGYVSARIWHFSDTHGILHLRGPAIEALMTL